MMETLFLSNWQHEKNGRYLNNPNRYINGAAADQVEPQRGGMEEKRIHEARRRNASAIKRRRLRAGAPARSGRDQ
jgi:DNA excision repair protein ERCC-4